MSQDFQRRMASPFSHLKEPIGSSDSFVEQMPVHQKLLNRPLTQSHVENVGNFRALKESEANPRKSAGAA
jgi:hypothetical protein